MVTIVLTYQQLLLVTVTMKTIMTEQLFCNQTKAQTHSSFSLSIMLIYALTTLETNYTLCLMITASIGALIITFLPDY